MYGLIDMFHHIVMGMRSAVGSHESVDAEIAVIGSVAKVAAVCPKLIIHEFKTA